VNISGEPGGKGGRLGKRIRRPFPEDGAGAVTGQKYSLFTGRLEKIFVAQTQPLIRVITRGFKRKKTAFADIARLGVLMRRRASNSNLGCGQVLGKGPRESIGGVHCGRGKRQGKFRNGKKTTVFGSYQGDAKPVWIKRKQQASFFRYTVKRSM